MKFVKKVVLFIVLLLLCSVALAEPAELPACPHLYRIADDQGSMQCVHCGEEAALYPQYSERSERKGVVRGRCDHRFVLLADALEEGWYPLGNTDIPMHEYRVCCLAVCTDCFAAVPAFTGSERYPAAAALCDYGGVALADALHFHLQGEGRHIYVLTCVECGGAHYVEQECQEYEGGFCAQELQDLGMH